MAEKSNTIIQMRDVVKAYETGEGSNSQYEKVA
jgi:hypothetical protein